MIALPEKVAIPVITEAFRLTTDTERRANYGSPCQQPP